MIEVSGRYLKSFFDACVENGARPEALAQVAGGGQPADRWPGQRFDGRELIAMLHAARDETGDSAIGVKCGQTLRPKSFQDVGYGVMACANLREGLAFNTRFQTLTQTIGRSWLDVNAATATLCWTPAMDDCEALAPLTEAVFAAYAAIGRWLVWEAKVDILRLDFRHEPVGHAGFITDVFGCQPTFGADGDRLVFPAKIADMPLPTANPELVELMTARLEGELARLSQATSLSDEVTATVETLMPGGAPTGAAVARRLGLTERTLRRRLKAEGTSFSDLLRSARMEACRLYIRSGRHSMAEIAQLLGYSEQSAFARAFRGWFGTSVSEFRDGAGTGPTSQ